MYPAHRKKSWEKITRELIEKIKKEPSKMHYVDAGGFEERPNYLIHLPNLASVCVSEPPFQHHSITTKKEARWWKVDAAHPCPYFCDGEECENRPLANVIVEDIDDVDNTLQYTNKGFVAVRELCWSCFIEVIANKECTYGIFLCGGMVKPKAEDEPYDIEHMINPHRQCGMTSSCDECDLDTPICKCEDCVRCVALGFQADQMFGIAFPTVEAGII